VALGVAVGAQAPQVPKLVAPAMLSRDDVVNLGCESSACGALEAVAPERPEPEPSPSSGRASALRMLGARLGVRARRHAADGQRSRHRTTVAASVRGPRGGIGPCGVSDTGQGLPLCEKQSAESEAAKITAWQVRRHHARPGGVCYRSGGPPIHFDTLLTAIASGCGSFSIG
jgi:hypothetical protein